MAMELKRAKDPEVVGSDDLLMEFPAISTAEWRESAVGYLEEARQIALVLDQRQNPADALLDQADHELAVGNMADAISLLRDAWRDKIDPSTPIGLHSGVRAGFMAIELPGGEPDATILPSVSRCLRHAGLDDVAHVLEDYGEITARLDDETARLLRLGALARVEQWAKTSVEFEDSEPA